MTISECKEIFALLSEYLDGELPEDVCQQVDSHISGCAPCVEFVESLTKNIKLCRSYKAQELPGPLPAAVREELFGAYQRMLALRKGGEA